MPVDVNVTLPDRRAATCEAALMEPHLRADQLGVRSECRALQGDRDPDPPAGRHVSPNDAQVWRVRQSQTNRACCCRRARERDGTNQSDVGTARHHLEVTSARPRKVVRSGTFTNARAGEGVASSSALRVGAAQPPPSSRWVAWRGWSPRRQPPSPETAARPPPARAKRRRGFGCRCACTRARVGQAFEAARARPAASALSPGCRSSRRSRRPACPRAIEVEPAHLGGFGVEVGAELALTHCSSRCGLISAARRISYGVPGASLVSWRGLLSGLARR